MPIDLIKLKKSFDSKYNLNGEDEYFSSAVLVLLMPIKGDYHFVFQKRAAHIRQGGEVSFPGGKVESTDASMQATALRETYEEIGIPPDQVEILGQLSTIITHTGMIVNAFIGTTQMSLDELSINEEVETLFTLPVSYFIQNPPQKYKAQVKIEPSYTDAVTGKEIILLPSKELGLPPMYHQAWGAFKYTIYVYETHHGTIWGITARLILETITRLV